MMASNPHPAIFAALRIRELEKTRRFWVAQHGRGVRAFDLGPLEFETLIELIEHEQLALLSDMLRSMQPTVAALKRERGAKI